MSNDSLLERVNAYNIYISIYEHSRYILIKLHLLSPSIIIISHCFSPPCDPLYVFYMPGMSVECNLTKVLLNSHHFVRVKASSKAN